MEFMSSSISRQYTYNNETLEVDLVLWVLSRHKSTSDAERLEFAR